MIKPKNLADLAELTILINRKKGYDIRAFSIAKIEETLKGGGSLRTTKRKLGIGGYLMYDLRDENGKVRNNLDEIFRLAQKFYAQFCDSDASREEISESSDVINGEAPAKTKEEVEHARKGGTEGKQWMDTA